MAPLSSTIAPLFQSCKLSYSLFCRCLRLRALTVRCRPELLCRFVRSGGFIPSFSCMAKSSPDSAKDATRFAGSPSGTPSHQPTEDCSQTTAGIPDGNRRPVRQTLDHGDRVRDKALAIIRSLSARNRQKCWSPIMGLPKFVLTTISSIQAATMVVRLGRSASYRARALPPKLFQAILLAFLQPAYLQIVGCVR